MYYIVIISKSSVPIPQVHIVHRALSCRMMRVRVALILLCISVRYNIALF